MTAKPNPRARHKARRLALQAIFQWQFTAHASDEIESQLATKKNLENIDLDYFQELLHGVVKHKETIDSVFSPFLDRPIDELLPIELAALRIGVYELKYREDVPYRVVINEALELTKQFGASEGHKYVNSILDNVAKQLRKKEIGK